MEIKLTNNEIIKIEGTDNYCDMDSETTTIYGPMEKYNRAILYQIPTKNILYVKEND